MVIVGDMIPSVSPRPESFGCETVDLSTAGDFLGDAIAEILREPVVDAAVDAVGFEARGHGTRRR